MVLYYSNFYFIIIQKKIERVMSLKKHYSMNTDIVKFDNQAIDEFILFDNKHR